MSVYRTLCIPVMLEVPELEPLPDPFPSKSFRIASEDQWIIDAVYASSVPIVQDVADELRRILRTADNYEYFRATHAVVKEVKRRIANGENPFDPPPEYELSRKTK